MSFVRIRGVPYGTRMATKARNVWVLSLCETEKEAFEVLGAAVLDGYAADGVYDLDTAEKIYIEVPAPIVTRADVQGLRLNWLEE